MSQSGKVKVSITKVKKEAQSQGEGERVMREGIVQTPKWAESPTRPLSPSSTPPFPWRTFHVSRGTSLLLRSQRWTIFFSYLDRSTTLFHPVLSVYPDPDGSTSLLLLFILVPRFTFISRC